MLLGALSEQFLISLLQKLIGVLRYHKNSYIRALADLYPELKLQRRRFYVCIFLFFH